MKIRNGTPRHDGASLCYSCRYATVVTGSSFNDEIVSCGKLDRPHNRIRFKVVDCNTYQDKASPSLGAMRDIAWELRTDKSGRQIGFMSPEEARRREKDIVSLPYLDDPHDD